MVVSVSAAEGYRKASTHARFTHAAARPYGAGLVFVEPLLPTRMQQRSKRETAETHEDQDDTWVRERARRRESHEEALREGLRVCLREWQRLKSGHGEAEAHEEQDQFRASHRDNCTAASTDRAQCERRDLGRARGARRDPPPGCCRDGTPRRCTCEPVAGGERCELRLRRVGSNAYARSP